MIALSHLAQGFDYLNDWETYQVWLNGRTELFTAFGTEIKHTYWSNHVVGDVSFACLNTGPRSYLRGLVDF